MMKPVAALSRKHIGSVLLLATLHAAAPFRSVAQTNTPAVDGWTRVEALRTGTKVHISLDRGGKTCHIYSVTDDALTCANGKTAGDVIQRGQIKQIKVPHVLRSTFTGLAVGVGVGAITGYAIGRSNDCRVKPCFDIIGPGTVAAIGGIGFGVVGAGVGAATDFTRGGAIYKR